MTTHAHDAQLAAILLSKHEQDGVQYEAMATGSGVNATTISRFARGAQALEPGSYKKLRDYVKTEWNLELPVSSGGSVGRIIVTMTCDSVKYENGLPVFVNAEISGIQPA